MTTEKMLKDLLKWCQKACPNLLQIEVDSQEKQTLLHLASSEGYTDIVKELISLGADVNAQDNSLQTPLVLNLESHLQTQHGKDTEILKLLLENGAHVNTIDIRKATPLHTICEVGDLEGTRLLLENGANLEAYDDNGYSPFGLALVLERIDVCELLLEKEPTLLNKIANTKDGDYPIHIASKCDDSDMIKVLIKKGCNVKSTNKEGLSPIHLAAMKGNLEVVKAIIRRLPHVSNQKNKSGQTPIHIAVAYNKIKVVSELLKYYSPAYAFGTSLIHAACKLGDIQMVKLIFEKFPFYNVKDKHGLAPLHVAVKNKNSEIVHFLAQKSDCNLNVKDKDGKTALDMAIEENLFDIAKILSQEISKYIDNRVTAGPTKIRIPRPLLPKDVVSTRIASGDRIPLEVRRPLNSPRVKIVPKVPNSSECMICLGPKNGIFAFQPCGHAKTCEGCTKKIIEGSDPCPICRKEVKEYQKIFV